MQTLLRLIAVVLAALGTTFAHSAEPYPGKPVGLIMPMRQEAVPMRSHGWSRRGCRTNGSSRSSSRITPAPRVSLDPKWLPSLLRTAIRCCGPYKRMRSIQQCASTCRSTP